MPGLNPKQLKFVDLYQRTLAAGRPNATQAYMDAYGVKDARVAKANASRLLTNAAKLLGDVRPIDVVIHAKSFTLASGSSAANTRPALNTTTLLEAAMSDGKCTLSSRRRRFVLEYMIDFNQTQAAIRAGYSSSPAAAKVTGSRLLATPLIAEAIATSIATMDENLKAIALRTLALARQKGHAVRRTTAPNHGAVYFLQESYGLVKIGKAVNAPTRIAELAALMPYPVTVLLVVPTDNRHQLEAEFHARFAAKRVRGEWFRLTHEDVTDLRRVYSDVDLSADPRFRGELAP